MTWRTLGLLIWWGYAGMSAAIMLTYMVWAFIWGPDYTVYP